MKATTTTRRPMTTQVTPKSSARIKLCSRCHVLKRIEAFSLRYNGHHSAWCKPCHAAYSASRRAARRRA